MVFTHTLLFLTTWLVAASPGQRTESPEVVVASVSCKPSAPLEISLETSVGPTGRLELDYTLTPQLDAAWVRAEIDLVHGGQVIRQLSPDNGPALRGSSRKGRAEIQLPAAVLSGAHAAEVHVVASMGLTQPDGSIERLVTRAVAIAGGGPLPVEAEPVQNGPKRSWDVGALHTPGSPATAASGNGMTVSGRFLYVDRAFTYSSGWTGEEPELPVRRARVLVLDAITEAVLASGETDMNGHYSLTVGGSGSLDLVVRCVSESLVLGPSAVTVVNTQDAQPFSVSSPVFADWDLGLDLDAGSTVAMKVTSGSRQANPFNMLDMAVDAFGYLDFLGQPPSTSPLTISWPSGSSSSGSELAIWIATDDGYDDLVMLHELGHSIDFRYSAPDSNGGSHSFGQSDQQPSLSLSEGFASYFAGAVRQFSGVDNPGFYMDASGTAVTGPTSIGLRLDYETRSPWKQFTGGEADEVAVCCALWNVIDTAATPDGDMIDDDPVDGSFLFAGQRTGDQLVFETLTAPTVLQANNVHIIDVWDGMFVDLGAHAHYTELAAAFSESKIAVRPDADEPSDSPLQAVLLIADSGWSSTRSLVAGTSSPPVPGLGDEDHYAFDLPAKTVFEVETRYPNGKADAETYADTFIEVMNRRGEPIASDNDAGVGRNGRVLLASSGAGRYAAVVKTLSPSNRTGRYQVRVRTLGELQAPIVDTVTPVEVVSVPEGYLLSLTLEGEHFVGTDRVSVGGVDTNFSVQDDSHIIVTMPIVKQLGLQDVVVENPVGEDSIPINVVAPATPALNVNSGTLFWSNPEIPVRMGGEPFDVMYLFASSSNSPTQIPGVLDLAIGAGGTDLVLIDVVPLRAAGAVLRNYHRPTGITSLTKVWVQGAILRHGSSELIPSNVEPGILLP